MTEQEINHYIAVNVNGWIHDEGIFYHDVNGNTCYMADYCNSVNHALDLAKANEVGLKPSVDGWTAYKLSNETILGVDMLPSKAICLCLVANVPA